VEGPENKGRCWSLRNVAEVDEGGAKDFDVDIEFSRVADHAWYGLVYNYLLEWMATSSSAS
jgi:hypothetical protein